MEDVGVFSRRVSRMHLLMARIALALYMPNGPYYGFALGVTYMWVELSAFQNRLWDELQSVRLAFPPCLTDGIYTTSDECSLVYEERCPGCLVDCARCLVIPGLCTLNTFYSVVELPARPLSPGCLPLTRWPVSWFSSIYTLRFISIHLDTRLKVRS